MNNKKFYVEAFKKYGIITDEVCKQDIEYLWGKLTKGSNELPLVQLKKFIKIVSVAHSHTNNYEHMNIDIADPVNLDQFKFICYGLFLRLKIPMQDVFIEEIIPRNQSMMNRLKDFTKIPFSEEEHNRLLIDLWRKAFPETKQIPPIPSELWKELGFQGTNPSTDFRGSGVFGLYCLLYLADYYDYFHFLLNSSYIHEIPFATAGINVVNVLFELMGWGFKSPGVPTCKNPMTLKILMKILFDTNGMIDFEDELEESKEYFYKLFILIFSLVEAVWTSLNASYMDFLKVVNLTVNRTEEILLNNIKNRYGLNIYLKEVLKLDIKYNPVGQKFIIYYEDGLTSKLYNPQQNLREVTESFSFNRGLKDYVVLDPLDREITNIDVKIQELLTQEVRIIKRVPVSNSPSSYLSNPTKHNLTPPLSRSESTHKKLVKSKSTLLNRHPSKHETLLEKSDPSFTHGSGMFNPDKSFSNDFISKSLSRPNIKMETDLLSKTYSSKVYSNNNNLKQDKNIRFNGINSSPPHQSDETHMVQILPKRKSKSTHSIENLNRYLNGHQQQTNSTLQQHISNTYGQHWEQNDD